jgi:hypothetical protein
MTEGTSAEQARKDIDYIKTIIEEGRTVLIENGSSFIIWGIAIPLGTIASYLLPLVTTSPLAFAGLWIGVYALGFAAFFLKNRGRDKAKSKTSYAGKIYGAVWIGVGITMTIPFIAFFASDRIELNVCMGFISCSIGGAYFVSGDITRYRWLKVLAFFWWAGGAACFFMPALWAPAAVAAMVVLFELLPGIIAYARMRRAGHAA